MATQTAKAQDAGDKLRAADCGALPDYSSAARCAALWARNKETPDPRATISAMWASSIMWAAESLADLVSTTVGNVKRP